VALGERFRFVNHFSYFTVLSNVFAAVVALLGVFSPVSGQIRGAAVLYMTTTGIVYALLLRGIDVQTPAYANWVAVLPTRLPDVHAGPGPDRGLVPVPVPRPTPARVRRRAPDLRVRRGDHHRAGLRRVVDRHEIGPKK